MTKVQGLECKFYHRDTEFTEKFFSPCPPCLRGGNSVFESWEDALFAVLIVLPRQLFFPPGAVVDDRAVAECERGAGF